MDSYSFLDQVRHTRSFIRRAAGKCVNFPRYGPPAGLSEHRHQRWEQLMRSEVCPRCPRGRWGKCKVIAEIVATLREDWQLFNERLLSIKV